MRLLTLQAFRNKRLFLITIMMIVVCSIPFLVLWIQHSGSVDSGTVAIYADTGAAEGCVTASKNMFLWMGHTVGTLTAEQIRKGDLQNFKLLCIPGGDMYDYARTLSTKGMLKIQEFVRAGGGYIGICGGSYFAAKRIVWRNQALPMTSLAFFSGSAIGPIDEIAKYPKSAMVEIRITNHTHPITENEPSSLWIAYIWGPYFDLPDTTNVTILGQYARTNHPAILALQYGKGRIFLIGAHPEFEEDSTRDDTDIMEEYDDQGSEWELMKKAAAWCLNEEATRGADLVMDLTSCKFMRSMNTLV